MSRISAHLASAYRLHQRLSQTDAASSAPVDAVLDAQGRIAHAEGEARSNENRERLGEATRLREWARGRIRTEDSARAVGAWKGLVQGQWTLVDELESDGKRYILARANRPCSSRISALSMREREVVSLAALGRSNKFIAYELGLAHSTVRVLMRRAAEKLGVRSRAERVERHGRMAVDLD